MKKTKFFVIGMAVILLTVWVTLCTSCGHTHIYTKSNFNETTHWKECSYCGDKIDEESHIFESWYTVQEPTETTTGTKERKCTGCSYIETESIPVITPTNGLIYALNPDAESYCVASKGSEKNASSIIIPSTYNDLPVTKINNRVFRNSSSLISITIPESVTSIGEEAFENCNSLTSITIPNSVTSIGRNAVAGCNSLTSITIPFVGAIDFYGQSLSHFSSIFGDSSSSIPNSLKEVIITSGTSIENYAFSGCSSLESITIPNSVTSIGESAFKGCSSLKNITISSQIKSIGSSAFYKSNNIENIYYEGSIEDWCKGPFTGATLFSSSNLNHFYIRNSNNEWEEVTSIEIPNTITEIGAYQFYGFSKVTSIKIPTGVTSIGKSAFSHCSSLTSITIPGSVTSIGDYAFSRCSSLTSITIPGSVTSIGDYAFSRCFKLVEIYNLSSLTIEKGSTDNGYVGYYANVIHSSSDEESKLVTKDGYIFVQNSDNQFSLVGYTGTDSELILPNDVNGNLYKIHPGAFSNNSSLMSIVIPHSVTSIGESAFEGCNRLTSIAIPNKITSIEDNVFYGCSSLASITIPNGITSIGENAFYGCSSLASITIPNRVTSIWLAAFEGCSSLTSITIPNSITSMEAYAFYGCSSLTNVYYAGSIEDWCNINFANYDSNPMRYASHFYIRNSNNEWEEVTNIEIPNTVTKIRENQFRGFNNVTSITIPGSVTSIGKNAFYDCFRLVEVYNLSSLTIEKESTDNGYVGYYANVIHSSLEEESKLVTKDCYIFVQNSENQFSLVGYTGTDSELILPNDVNEKPYKIHPRAFSNNRSLTSIVIPNSVTSIGESAFEGCSSLKSITLGNVVTSIEDNVFYGCSSLASITIPNSITSIGKNAFQNCNSLVYNEYDNGYYLGNEANSYLVLIKAKSTDITTCEINSKTKLIYSYAFYDSSLTSITIPNSITSIGYGAFRNCTSLTNVYYQGSMADWCKLNCTLFYPSYRYTNSNHFYIRNSNNEWEEVTRLEIPNTVTEIGDYQFCGFKNITSITIPDSVTSIGQSAFEGCSSLKSITIPDSVTSIGKSAFEWCSSLKSITLGNGVTSIGQSAFYDCSSLTSITIPNSITSIGDYAFQNCNSLVYNEYDNGYYLGNETNPYVVLIKAKSTDITTCEINSKTKLIYRYAFNDCNSLTSITIPNSVTSIEDNVFYGCSSLASITILNGITSIGKNAFYGCSSLTSITIPNSITSIGDYVFYAGSNLKEVYYYGSSAQWNSIEKGYNNGLISAILYYYSETQPTEEGNYWHYVNGVATKW